MLKRIISLAIPVLLMSPVFSQETLPRFTMVDHSDKVTISWSNPFGDSLIQLNVQRSFDSLRYFTTVFSAESPELLQNGFTEKKMPTNRIFYRIFFVLAGGSYSFTQSVRVGTNPSFTTARDVKNPSLTKPPPAADTRVVTIKIKDTVYRKIPIVLFQNFRDSILKLTKDTLTAINDELVILRPFVAKEIWRPSIYIYANKDGLINISLPRVTEDNYRIKFFEENGNLLFEIPRVKESPLILDKSNFIHSGWFTFELYEDGRLKEKNKFYLPKDF